MSVSARYPHLTSLLAMEMERYLREVAIAETQCCCHCPKCGRRYSDQDDGGENDEEDDEKVEVDLERNSLDRIKEVRVKEFRPAPPNYVDNFDSNLLSFHSSYGGGRRRRQSIKNKLVEPAKPKGLSTALPAQSTEHNEDGITSPATPPSVDLSVSSSASDTTTPPLAAPSTPATAQKPARQPRNQRYRAPPIPKRSFDLPNGDDQVNVISIKSAPKDQCQGHVEQAISINEPKVKQKTRPTQRHGSFDSATTDTIVDSTSKPCRPQVNVSPQSKLLFLRMFGAVPVTLTGRSPIHFNDFVAAMIDAGFTVEHSGKCGGSGVNFKDLSGKHGGRKISFHRPHPDPKVPHHKLRTWGTRLQDKFGWDVESFGEKDS